MRRFFFPLVWGLVLSCLCLTVCPARCVWAQVPDEEPPSVGVPPPDSARPVQAYRLPTWHWSQWTLRANGQALRSSDRRRDPDRAGGTSIRGTDRFDLGLDLNPRYRAFWESEERRAVLRAAPYLILGRGGRTTLEGNGDRTANRSVVRPGVRLRGTLREYLRRSVFLVSTANGALAYGREWTEGDNGETTIINSDVQTDVRLGIGVGRVRIVTPVIRALRVRERLRAVAPGQSMSDDQVQEAARQLARRPGYRSVYDRPDKYFWRDFFDRAGLSNQSPFVTFYVADVLREPVGVRREGAEFALGTTGGYRRDLRREERRGVLVDRKCGARGSVGAFATGRWYRNVTLRHQLGAEVDASYRRFVDSQGPLDHEVGLDAEGQWLWVLADRLRLDTRLRATLQYENDPRGGETFRPRHRYMLTSDLLFFVENSLSFRAGANVQYRYDATDSDGVRRSGVDTGLQFRVNYVVSRALR